MSSGEYSCVALSPRLWRVKLGPVKCVLRRVTILTSTHTSAEVTSLSLSRRLILYTHAHTHTHTHTHTPQVKTTNWLRQHCVYNCSSVSFIENRKAFIVLHCPLFSKYMQNL